MKPRPKPRTLQDVMNPFHQTIMSYTKSIYKMMSHYNIIYIYIIIYYVHDMYMILNNYKAEVVKSA